MTSGSQAPLAPDFIRFLFSTNLKFDCYFKVGNQSQGKPERIGAVKLMLMAHSEVFRVELDDSELKEKGDVPVKDVHPDTFKGMLKYVYGHDTTSDLCFAEADNMLYVAEKYMIKTLKDRLAVRLMKLLNPDNICSLLNNPACYTHLELDKAITEILRYETDRVLASPQFLWMNADGFLKILEQDGLAVPEIELWIAAIKWAKHRADSEDGQLLRQQLSDSGLTRHLRLCSLTAVEICAEVVATDVLTRDELSTVCQSVGRKQKPEGLTEICDEIVPRKRLNRVMELNPTDPVMSPDLMKEAFQFIIATKQHAVELLPLVCLARNRDSMHPERRSQRVNCSTTIVKIPKSATPTTTIIKIPKSAIPSSSSTNESSVAVIPFSGKVKCDEEFVIPLTVGGRNITLLPKTAYMVKMEFSGCQQRCRKFRGVFGSDHLILGFSRDELSNYFPCTKLQYRVTTVE